MDTGAVGKPVGDNAGEEKQIVRNLPQLVAQTRYTFKDLDACSADEKHCYVRRS